MPKAIKTVKTKTQLQTLLTNIQGVGRSLLTEWINLDPIYTGLLTKANYEESIKKHLIDSTKHLSVDGYWCEFGVREGRSLKWLIEAYPKQTSKKPIFQVAPLFVYLFIEMIYKNRSHYMQPFRLEDSAPF